LFRILNEYSFKRMPSSETRRIAACNAILAVDFLAIVVAEKKKEIGAFIKAHFSKSTDLILKYPAAETTEKQMVVVFYISYALPHCTTEMVRAKFDTMFQNIVVTITEEIKDDNERAGKKFKRFWIKCDETLNRFTPSLDYVLEMIQKLGYAQIYYEKSNGVDRYWKVKLAPPVRA